MKLRDWIARVQDGQPLVSPPAPWECAPNVPNPLLATLKLGRLDAFDRLLQAGWDINAGVSLVAFCLDQPEDLEFLISRGARVDVADAYGATDLIRRVLRPEANSLRRLLARAPNPARSAPRVDVGSKHPFQGSCVAPGTAV